MSRKLLMLPFAGGNSYSYRFLFDSLSEYELVCPELPGRGKRIREPLLNNSTALVDDIVNQVQENLNGEYSIYGHSMGALLAYGVAERMSKLGKAPIGVIVSGNAGPCDREKLGLYRLENDDFRRELKKLGGVPEEVLNSEELMEFFTPILKSDFKVAEDFDYSPYGPINVPIFAIMGDSEKNVDKIEAWKNLTNVFCTTDVVEGNHFFLFKNQEVLLQRIEDCFERQTI